VGKRTVTVELYKFFWEALAWIATVTVCVPINAIALALAYSIQNGPKPLSIDRGELAYRSVVGAVLLALVTVALVFLDYIFIDISDFPPGPVHLVIFMAYVPAAAYVVVISFAYSELVEGVSVVVIDIGLCVFVLFLIHTLLGWWSWPLSVAHDYLKMPT
jgi:hypothetical protein